MKRSKSNNIQKGIAEARLLIQDFIHELLLRQKTFKKLLITTPDKERFSWIIFNNQISNIVELAKFSLSINNKKFIFLPVRSILEIVWILEDFSKTPDKQAYFETLEKHDHELFLGSASTYPIPSNLLIKKKQIKKISEGSRVPNYESYYKIASGIVHGNSLALRIVSRDRSFWYLSNLIFLARFIFASIDLTFEIEDQFLSKTESIIDWNKYDLYQKRLSTLIKYLEEEVCAS